MEVFRSDEFYIFVQEAASLWWNRNTAEFSCKSAWDLSGLEDIECLGITPAIIGKIEHEAIYEPKLVIVKDCTPVGNLYDDHIIYKIKSISLLPIGNEEIELNLTPCKKHSTGSILKTHVVENIKGNKRDSGKGLFENSVFVNKTWGAVKSAGNTIKTTTQQAAAIATSQVKQTVTKRRDSKERDRLEKRITEELHKIFDDTDSFYFCKTADITNSLQRLEKVDVLLPDSRWKYADDRFFWNKYMLKDIINLGSPACEPWIIPVIQGHVQVRQCEVDAGECSQHLNTESLRGTATQHREIFTLSLISRRSRYRAGTRYKRRGVDENGYVANYVETEQSLVHRSHRVSFLQVRGSAPVYWSQPGMKYRPPPRLDRGELETQVAFEKHFDSELGIYGPICIVNLVEQAGREKVIWDAYSHHIYTYNCPDIIYTTFDFHEYCRGMHFENVTVLINALMDIITEMGYCWRDPQGYICRQNGVFRVNCIDCLDRTNVVQTAIAKAVLELQVTRLGLSGPDWPLPVGLRTTLHELWADNGDIISRQYAGTNALKGDYTRTGERKFTGIMKDGMNSANRYYLSRFKDAFRQATIDLMLGEAEVGELMLQNDAGESEDERQATADHVKQLIEDCKKLLISEPHNVVGAWGLIDADPGTGDPNETEMDSILILTRDSYLVADYDDQSDRVTKFQQLALSDITFIEFGIPETSSQMSLTSLKSNLSLSGPRKPTENNPCIRIHYKIDGNDGFFHMFRSTNLRFFNNMAIYIKTAEEMHESLRSICECFMVTIDVAGLPKIQFKQGGKLDRRKSKVRPNNNGGGGRKTLYLELSGIPGITRNLSETQLAIKSVGSKALTNMSEQFSKLNKLGHTFNTRAKNEITKPFKLESIGNSAKTTFTMGKSSIKKAVRKHTKGGHSDCTSSDNSSEDEGKTNIFEPTLDNFENCVRYVGDNPLLKSTTDAKDNVSSTSIQPDLNSEAYLMENPLYSSKIDSQTSGNDTFSSDFLPDNESIDIANTSELENKLIESDDSAEHKFTNVYNQTSSGVKLNPFDIDNENVDGAQIMGSNYFPEIVRSATPEITINFDDASSKWEMSDSKSNLSKIQPPSSLKLNQKLSHSSGEVDVNPNANAMTGSNTPFESEQFKDATNQPVRSSSQQDMNLSISQSQSESALKQLKNITSPVASVTKDLVLSPFSKIAKGMQSLGANLDPRKIKTGPMVKQITEQQYEEHRKLQEKWKKCNTRLIAL
ncbi:phosphatidylinositide phosphatase spermathreecae isoform X2 [Arctopsyche grandis]|uniref:phosphatidylinositide phosphatase spermathreecae isoform X2 n=1 Tax=Arctopsyche grandis TaxID=121162 RepID=UPI00406D7544